MIANFELCLFLKRLKKNVEEKIERISRRKEKIDSKLINCFYISLQHHFTYLTLLHKY